MPRNAKSKGDKRRGVALLMVMVSIAILTALATDFAYNTRVDLQLAANARDDLRAHYLAKSGIGLSRLLLRFQRQLDNLSIPGLNLPGVAGGAAPSMNLQLWRMARVDCHLLAGMISGSSAFRPIASAEVGADSTGVGPGGCFNATLSDEEERINLSRLDAPVLSSQPTIVTLLQLWTDKRFEFLFEKEDANRVKATPQEVLISLKDWVDEDEVQSSLNLSGSGDIMLKGFSDENYNYDRYTPRYKSKNGRFDSLDEIYMVHGVNDLFMAAFGDRLTVYPDINRNLNINSEDPLVLYMAILSIADPARPDPRLQNPLFIEQLLTQIKLAKTVPFLGMGVVDFINVVGSSGVAVNESIRNNVKNNRFISDKSQTFRIKSVGEAGQVKKTLTAVVRLDDRLGQLLYWKEE